MPVIGHLKPFPQVEGRVQEPPGESVALRPGEVVGHGQQPAQEIEGAGENDHRIVLLHRQSLS